MILQGGVLGAACLQGLAAKSLSISGQGGDIAMPS